MTYRNYTLYTLRYVAQMLEEDEAFLHDCSIEMFPEDGCLSAYDEYPATERRRTDCRLHRGRDRKPPVHHRGM